MLIKFKQMKVVAGSFPSLATRVDSEDHYTVSLREKSVDSGASSLTFKTHGQSQTKPKTENTSGSKSGDFSPQKLKQKMKQMCYKVEEK